MTKSPVRFNIDSMPIDLRNLPQWVAWRYITRDGKPTKVPISSIDGSMADYTLRSHWGTFEQAVAACHSDRSLAGVGFVFSEDDPYCGVDLDDSVDETTGVVKPWCSKSLIASTATPDQPFRHRRKVVC